MRLNTLPSQFVEYTIVFTMLFYSLKKGLVSWKIT